MSDMAVGIPIGFGAGFATGIASGQKKALDKVEKNIRYFTLTHRITIQNERGQSVSVEEFITEVVRRHEEKSRRVIIVKLVIAGLLLLLGIAMFLFLSLRAA